MGKVRDEKSGDRAYWIAIKTDKDRSPIVFGPYLEDEAMERWQALTFLRATGTKMVVAPVFVAENEEKSIANAGIAFRNVND